MRKFILPLLLASVAASPAMAGPRDDSTEPTRVDRAERQQIRAERQQAREERASTHERPQLTGQGNHNGFNGGMNGGAPQLASPQQAGTNGGQPPMTATEHAGYPHHGLNGGGGGHGNGEGVNGRSEDNAGTATYVAPGPRAVHNPFVGDSVRELRREQREQALDGQPQGHVRGPHVVTNGMLRDTDRPVARVLRAHTPPVVSTVPREGTQPPLRTDNHHRGNRPGWSTDWRHDHRYDWHNWRNHHHSWFHLGFYYDPFGWGYSPFSIGWRMWPSYYGSRYWINDPYQYRLPYAPPGYRWVRYYDDAVLVDTWTGEVVDVIYDFFW